LTWSLAARAERGPDRDQRSVPGHRLRVHPRAQDPLASPLDADGVRLCGPFSGGVRIALPAAWLKDLSGRGRVSRHLSGDSHFSYHDSHCGCAAGVRDAAPGVGWAICAASQDRAYHPAAVDLHGDQRLDRLHAPVRFQLSLARVELAIDPRLLALLVAHVCGE